MPTLPYRMRVRRQLDDIRNIQRFQVIVPHAPISDLWCGALLREEG